jgi:predicted PurR-regulated permease PerM
VRFAADNGTRLTQNWTMSREYRFQRAFLLLLLIAISAAFVAMIRDFLLIILLSGIFAGLSQPIYLRLLHAFRGRQALASLTTLLLVFLLVVGPLATVTTIVVNQAVQVSDNVRPRVQQLLEQPTLLDQYLQHLPFYDRLRPYRTQILTKAGELIGTAGTALVRSLSGTIGGTVIVIVQFFIFLYTMFFLLKDGKRMLDGALTYLPLPEEDKRRMVGRFTSVARATIKGTLFIGILQGTLSGLAFWVVGIQGALFWTVLMIVLSIVPGIGGALVWVPAAAMLMLTGSLAKGLLLAGFCALVVGSIDNLLRPRLVGRDTQLHDLLIFFSTIGGLVVFGPMGFIVGPIVAALFVTVWEIYGAAFRDELGPPAGAQVPRPVDDADAPA